MPPAIHLRLRREGLGIMDDSRPVAGAAPIQHLPGGWNDRAIWEAEFPVTPLRERFFLWPRAE